MTEHIFVNEITKWEKNKNKRDKKFVFEYFVSKNDSFFERS